MQTLMPWIAVAVTIVAGWALIKRYQTHMVLLFAASSCCSAPQASPTRASCPRA